MKLLTQCGEVEAGTIGDVIETRNSHHGAQSYIDFGTIGMWVYIDNVELAND